MAKKNLADLRGERSTARPQAPYRAVVGEGQKYVAEIQRLSEEHDDVLVNWTAEQGPRKMGAKADDPPRVLEIKARLGELAGLMAEYEGELLIEGTKTEGEWADWRIKHPARDKGEPGHLDDLQIADGYCNAEDLIADLATYVVAWEGEELAPGDFEALNLMRPDKKKIAGIVAGMYEEGIDLPKLLSGLSMLRPSEPLSDSPETSGSASDASTAGSPESPTSTSTATTGE